MRKLPPYAVGSRLSIENRTDMLYRVVDRHGTACHVIADGIDVSTARMLVRQDAERAGTNAPRKRRPTKEGGA